MAKLLFDYDEVVKALVQDRAEKLTPEHRVEAIQQAVYDHSKIRPLTKRRSLTGTGTAIIGTPTGWNDEISTVSRIEYPVGEVPPTYLEADAWVLTSSPTAATTYQILLFSGTIGTAQHVNLEWTAPHVVTDSAGTIPDGHYRAVAMLGASYACLQLAGFFAQSGDPTIHVDSQDPMSKSQEYRDLARDYANRYREFFGLGPMNGKDGSSIAAAGMLVDIDRRTSYGFDFFSHPKRWR